MCRTGMLNCMPAMTSRSSHTLELSEKLWALVEHMSLEMGFDAQTLASHALISFAVAHGHLRSGQDIAEWQAPPQEGNEPATEPVVLPLRSGIGQPQRRLWVLVGGRAPLEVVSQKFTIGRDFDCELPLVSSRISRHHARIDRDSMGVFIEDLGSSNGTFFDGERITRKAIEHGDEFTIGDYLLRFEYR